MTGMTRTQMVADKLVRRDREREMEPCVLSREGDNKKENRDLNVYRQRNVNGAKDEGEALVKIKHRAHRKTRKRLGT